MRRDVALIGLLLFLLTIAKGVVWIAMVPLGQHPDEPAHVNYVDATVHDPHAWRGSQNASRGPELAVQASEFYRLRSSPGERRSFAPATVENRRVLLAESVTERHELAPPLDYELRVGYPPLYYFVAGQIVRATNTWSYDQTWFLTRMLSVLIAAMTILIQFAILLAIFRGHVGKAGLAALTLTMLPMYTAMESAVNPEVLLVFWASALLLASLRIANRPLERKHYIIAGIVFALGSVTKPSIVVMLAPVPAAMFFGLRGLAPPRPTRAIVVNSIFLILPAVITYLTWRIAAARTGDVRIAGHPPVNISLEAISAFVHHLAVIGQRGFIDSFWGVYGWLDVPLADWIYGGLALFTIGLVATSIVGLLMKAATDPIRICVCGVVALFSLVLFLEFTLYSTGGFAQGRYLFPMITAIVAVAFWAMDFALSRRPQLRRASWIAAPIAVACLHVVTLGSAILPRFLL